MGELISASEAAKRLGISRQRIGKMIRDGLLQAVRVGNQWVIDADNLATINRKPGRPGKKRIIHESRK